MAVLSLRSILRSPTSIQTYIPPDHGIASRGNATVGGIRFTPAAWRSLQDHLDAHPCGLDRRRSRALVQAARCFDLALDHPLRVIRRGSVREVEVLGVVSFFADTAERTLWARMRNPEGFSVTSKEHVSVFPALWGRHWLAAASDLIGVDWRDRPGVRHDALDVFAEVLDASPPLFEPADGAATTGPIEKRFLAALARMLAADPRFRALRLAVGPKLVGDDVLSMAIRSRTPGLRNQLPIQELARVWRHFDAYSEVARHAPKLLPLLTLRLRSRSGHLEPERVLAVLKAELSGREPELAGDNAWRYVLAHGVRPFGPALVSPERACELWHLTALLASLADIGLPRPPSPAFLRAWRRGTVRPDTPPAGSHWRDLDASVRRIALAEAERRRHDPEFGRFTAEVERTLPWALSGAGGGLLVALRGAGWGWVVARCHDRRVLHEAFVRLSEASWQSVVGEYRAFGLVAIALTTRHALVEEGLAMDHCVGKYVDEAHWGTHRFFSIRTPAGKRVATFALASREGGCWTVDQVRRRSNADAGPLEVRLAHAIAAEYQRLAQAA